VNIYNIVFIGNDIELHDLIIQSLRSYEFSYFTLGNLEEFIDFSAENIAHLVVLSGDSEDISKDGKFKKLLIRENKKSPVFLFSRPAMFYSRDEDFEKNLVENIKKALGQNILPAKQTQFDVIKLGKVAKFAKERRETPRLRASIPFELYADALRSQKISGRLRDISAGGFSINSKEALPDKDDFWCAFSVEDGEDFFLKAVKLRANRTKEHWHTALRFSKMPRGDYKRINT